MAKIPSKSLASLLPISLKCSNPGAYSVAFALNGVSNISAKELKIHERNKEFAINVAKPFICTIIDIEQNIVVYLLDKRGVALTGGIIVILDDFVSLELL